MFTTGTPPQVMTKREHLFVEMFPGCCRYQSRESGVKSISMEWNGMLSNWCELLLQMSISGPSMADVHRSHTTTLLCPTTDYNQILCNLTQPETYLLALINWWVSLHHPRLFFIVFNWLPWWLRVSMISICLGLWKCIVQIVSLSSSGIDHTGPARHINSTDDTI